MAARRPTQALTVAATWGLAVTLQSGGGKILGVSQSGIFVASVTGVTASPIERMTLDRGCELPRIELEQWPRPSGHEVDLVVLVNDAAGRSIVTVLSKDATTPSVNGISPATGLRGPPLSPEAPRFPLIAMAGPDPSGFLQGPNDGRSRHLDAAQQRQRYRPRLVHKPPVRIAWRATNCFG